VTTFSELRAAAEKAEKTLLGDGPYVVCDPATILAMIDLLRDMAHYCGHTPRSGKGRLDLINRYRALAGEQ
jgi:hypothetical protein